ncbi:Cell division protein FtsI (Penicillin-binding protein 3) [Candidatus Electronema aureum]
MAAGGGWLLRRYLPVPLWSSHPQIQQETETVQPPSTTPLPVLRGAIYDRHVEEMAVSYQLYSLQAHPAELIDRQEAATQLARIIGMDAEAILQGLQSKEPVTELAVGLDARQAVEAEALQLPGISCIPIEVRYYPNHAAAGRLLGFVSEGVGLSGAEALYDGLLQPGAFRPAEATGVDFAGQTNLGPQAADLLLTLDLKLQKRLEQELEDWRRRKGAASGSAIVLDPETGRLLATVRQPSFDPNYFWQTGGQALPKDDGPLFPAEFFAELLEPLLTEVAIVQEAGLSSNELPATVSAPHSDLSQEQRAHSWQEFGFDQPAQDMLPLDPKQQPMPEESAARDGRLSVADIAVGTASVLNSGKRIVPWFLKAVYDPDRQQFFSRDLSSVAPKRLIPPAAGVQLRRQLLHESAWSSKEGFLFVNSTAAMVFKNGLSEHHLQDILIAAASQELPRILLVMAIDYGSLYPQPPDIDPTQDRELLAELGHRLLPILAKYTAEDALSDKPPGTKNEANLRRFLLSRRLNRHSAEEKSYEDTPQVMPDLIGLSLRQGLRRLNPHKLRVQIKGSGKIKAQKPAANASLVKIDTCELTLEPPFQHDTSAPVAAKPTRRIVDKNTPRSAERRDQPNHP